MKKLILCNILGLHKWTSLSEQGIKPDKFPEGTTDLQVVLSFCKYAKMYCSRCGVESEFSKKFNEELILKFKR